MYRIAVILLTAGIFFGPYAFLIDSRIHLLRVVVPLCILIFWKKIYKLRKIQLFILSFYFLYFVYTSFISITHYELIEYKDVINFIYIPLLILALVLIYKTNPKKFLELFNQFLTIYLCISFGLAVYEYITLDHLHLSASYGVTKIWDGYYHAPSTFFVNQNDFALTFVFGTMYKLYLMTGKRNLIKQIIWISVCSWVIYVTKSRINYLALFLFIIVYYRFWNIKYFTYGMGIVAFICLVLVAFRINIFNYQINLDFDPSRGSTLYRINLYKYAFLSIFENGGLGHGINMSENYYQNLSDKNLGGIVNPHAYILEILINSGFIFFILYILLNAILFTYLIRLKVNRIVFVQCIMYNLLLFSSSSSLFLWPHYCFFVVYSSREFWFAIPSK